MFQTHLCRVCDHPSPPFMSSSLSRSSCTISLPRNFSPCTSRFLTFPYSKRPVSLYLSLFYSNHLFSPFLSFSHPLHPCRTHVHPPTGEHSPCQTRIDLTLSVADYKSDQLGARCACRIGERSEGANDGRALSSRIATSRPNNLQPCTIAPCSPLLPAAPPLGD